MITITPNGEKGHAWEWLWLNPRIVPMFLRRNWKKIPDIAFGHSGKVTPWNGNIRNDYLLVLKYTVGHPWIKTRQKGSIGQSVRIRSRKWEEAKKFDLYRPVPPHVIDTGTARCRVGSNWPSLLGTFDFIHLFLRSLRQL